ncbi:MAG: hypothetical protein OEY28_10130, partial [Nitrospira sp.]|nr:hypothetical protein [Nitrospira sp.]
MRQMLVGGMVLCLFIASGTVEYAAGAGEQELSKGEDLLKSKQYVEARKMLEAGTQKDPSNIRGHFNLGEACRALEAWACAEEHYDTALQLDDKSGTSYLPKSKAKVWRLREEVKVWGLLSEARGLMAV